MKKITVYHGTCDSDADYLLQNGYNPNNKNTMVGGNIGQRGLLYVTTEPENAFWFAQEKGCDVVLEISDVSIEALIVDPEDGYGESVEEELKFSKETGVPAYLAVNDKLDKRQFSHYATR